MSHEPSRAEAAARELEATLSKEPFASLARDAYRYRWLRAHAKDKRTEATQALFWNHPSRRDFDRAVDDAMAEQGGREDAAYFASFHRGEVVGGDTMAEQKAHAAVSYEPLGAAMRGPCKGVCQSAVDNGDGECDEGTCCMATWPANGGR